MNIQTLSQSKALTMSSREIADLTDKQHSHVKRDIDKMCLEINHPNLESSDYEHRGNWYTQYHLDKELTLCLVAGYSANLRMMIIRRWNQLEEGQRQQLPQSFAQALQLAADQAKQLELQAPKVEYHDKVLSTQNGMTTTEIAAELGMSAIKLNQKLNDMKIQRKIGGRWVLRAAYVGKGHDVEQTFVDEEGNSRHSMKWTEKGRQLIHKLIGLQNEK